MGEVAEMMLDGTCCQFCGEFLDGEPVGYPIACAGCGDDSTPVHSGRSEGKKRREKRRKERLRKKKAETLKSQDSEGWKQHTEFHWSKSLCGLRFEFWPSTRKAMFNGQVYKNIVDIKEFEKTLEKGFKT